MNSALDDQQSRPSRFLVPVRLAVRQTHASASPSSQRRNPVRGCSHPAPTRLAGELGVVSGAAARKRWRVPCRRRAPSSGAGMGKPRRGGTGSAGWWWWWQRRDGLGAMPVPCGHGAEGGTGYQGWEHLLPRSVSPVSAGRTQGRIQPHALAAAGSGHRHTRRMVGVGRDLCGSPSPTPCPSRVTYSRL